VQLSGKFTLGILEQTVVQLHELVTVLALALLVGTYVALVANFGLVGAMLGGAFYLSLVTIAVVSLPQTPQRWDFPMVLPKRAQQRLWEARQRARTRL